MKTITELLNEIAKERPVGSEANRNVLKTIQKEAAQRGCSITLLPFECKTWKKGKSCLKSGSISQEIYPSPFSRPYSGSGEAVVIHTLEELTEENIYEKILFLQEELAKDPLMPKNYPFYYPDEHRQIIELLEAKKPKAVIAVTGKHPICGLEPFPMFEDGSFSIPSAYVGESAASKILSESATVKACIDSEVTNSNSSQIIAAKKSVNVAAGKIIICAHMDTKYNTPGAIDNAAGVAVLLETMRKLKDCSLPYDIEFVPFNSEEYYEAKGELEYLSYLDKSPVPVKLVINIDGACHKDSQIAVSSYNFEGKLSDTLVAAIKSNKNVMVGAPWYAGDHSVFAYRGIPCIAVTSSNLHGSVMELTHTEKDTADQISCELICEAADFLTGFVKAAAAE